MAWKSMSVSEANRTFFSTVQTQILQIKWQAKKAFLPFLESLHVAQDVSVAESKLFKIGIKSFWIFWEKIS